MNKWVSDLRKSNNEISNVQNNFFMKYWYGYLIIFLIILGSYSILYFQENYFINEKKEIIDCGIDVGCFVKSFETCTPSKFYGGLTEIKGGTPESCEIYFVSGEDPRFTGEERLSMTCVVEHTNKFIESDMNAFGVIERGFCKGSMYESYKELDKKLNELNKNS